MSAADHDADDALLAVKDLSVHFRARDANSEVITEAVRHVSFTLHAGETLALVGESGSGKSVTALSLLQLLPYPQAFHPCGSIRYRGVELIGAPNSAHQKIRGNDISMIFQEPMSALNPLHRIEKQIGESLALHQKLNTHAAREKTMELLAQVGIDAAARINAYPHQLSGGQRQRVMIAMALANKPEILLADEPTTALDVTVQARILALLRELQRAENLSLLLITHDLNMVRKIAERVLVMKNGRIVERGARAQIFTAPAHNYTRQLLAAEPQARAPSPPPATRALLAVEDLKVWFPIRRGILKRTVGQVKAVNRASFKLYPGRNLGIVGESGSGKTTLALAALRLLRASGGIIFDGAQVSALPRRAMKNLRREMQIVFQDPFGSLSPRMSVLDIVSEGLNAHRITSDAAARERRVMEILREVEIDPALRFRYPHEFSGGQRQRIAIARALILEPKVLFLDEPTSALDRTVQIQVLALLERIQQQRQLAYVFISHDLSVVRSIADELMVMRDGDVVEQGAAAEIFANPKHLYTRELLRAAFGE